MRAAHFVQHVADFNSDQISPDVRKLIKKKYLTGEFADQFNYEKVNKASKCTGPLFMWIKSQIEFADIKGKFIKLFGIFHCSSTKILLFVVFKVRLKYIEILLKYFFTFLDQKNELNRCGPKCVRCKKKAKVSL